MSETGRKRMGRKLTQDEVRRLQEARVASGRLGGRPRKPTHDEARDAKLEELVPRAVRVLEDQLDSPDARVRQGAAIRVLEYAWGKPTKSLEVREEKPAVFTWVLPKELAGPGPDPTSN
jgi:hypothetical protein